MAFIIPLRKEQIFTEKSGMKPTPNQLLEKKCCFLCDIKTVSAGERGKTLRFKERLFKGEWYVLTVGKHDCCWFCVPLEHYLIMQHFKKELTLKDKYILTLIKLLFGQPLRENIYLRVDERSLAHYCLFAVAKHKILSKFSTLQNKRQRGSTGSTAAGE